MRPPWRKALRGAGGERGQVLPLFALSLMAMIGMLALVIDAGLMFGQRRYTQNGADAGALAAVRLLVATPTASDLQVYQEVRRYAGLSTSDLASNVPPAGAFNVPGGLASQIRQAATVEYNNGDGWCVASGRPVPPRTPAPPTCATAPPAVRSGQPYRVRVTVSSTLNGFFARAVGLGDLAPPQPTTDTVPACLRPAGAQGITTCAHAVVSVRDVAGGPPYAIFTTQTGCGSYGVYWNGSGNTTVGGLHSSNEVYVNGSDNRVTGSVEVGCPSGVDVNGSNLNIPAAAESSNATPPVSFSLTDFPCTHSRSGAVSGTVYANAVSSGDYQIIGSGLTLTSGVYCVNNGELLINGSNIRGQVTLVAAGANGRVRFNGSDFGIAPFLRNVQVASFGTSGTVSAINGSGSSWRGIFYAPNGHTDFNGAGIAVANASIISRTLYLNGSGWRLDGSAQGVNANRRAASLTE